MKDFIEMMNEFYDKNHLHIHLKITVSASVLETFDIKYIILI